MKHVELGKTGEKIPCIGMGTWKYGVDPEGEVRAMKAGLKLGMRFIDTAEMYHSEHIVAKAIAGEKDLFIATKVSPSHFSYDDVIRSCNNSLKNLGIKTIDLYQLHWPSRSVPIRETMRAMEQLVKDGKIRHIGISNFSVDETIEAQAALKSERIVSNQVEYSVFVRDPEQDGLTSFCRAENITIIAYSPFARGHMFDEQRRKALATLESIGKRHGKTGAQVALNWLISKGNVAPIPKATSSEHVKENAEAADFSLTKEEITTIDAIDSSGIRSLG